MGWLIALVVLVVGCAGAEQADADPVWGAGFESIADEPTVKQLPEITCDEGSDDMPGARESRPEVFWAEDPVLRTALTDVLKRVTKASGLPLSVTPGGVEVVFTDLPVGYAGLATDHIDVDVAVDLRGTSLLMHEVLHMLGAQHLGPWEGVMARCIGNQSMLLTRADLEQLCSGAPCTAWNPENP
jgi:hypothetical protein